MTKYLNIQCEFWHDGKWYYRKYGNIEFSCKDPNLSWEEFREQLLKEQNKYIEKSGVKDPEKYKYTDVYFWSEGPGYGIII